MTLATFAWHATTLNTHANISHARDLAWIRCPLVFSRDQLAHSLIDVNRNEFT